LDFGAVKNVGDAAIDIILKERDTNGAFVSFNDFCLRVDGSKVTNVSWNRLSNGAMDQFGERNAMLPICRI
jgi:DNA polymerase-3 subunit alpha